MYLFLASNMYAGTTILDQSVPCMPWGKP